MVPLLLILSRYLSTKIGRVFTTLQIPKMKLYLKINDY